ncbi:S8 family peptidase [Azohydromonas caseinilytica]|uniref:S8 family serine peptidase n=1 Tax=Azohydromonas caseinilytica TaxID=2728836 RepID=A0A848FBG2_9BURK|nr:S8 family peptidase [Azohydromonas caseinilytica]NML16226.1 S8 family serine peptidase [Azohydromonas caseinilytica]
MNHQAAAAALAASALLAAGAAQARPLFDNPATAPVNGLIVRLRDAPAHAQVEREQALSRDRRSTLGERHRERLQRVLREAALDRAAIDVPSVPAISATGSASQVLRFDKPLTLEQAQRLARRLAARGDVLWVEPNVRERRLQSTDPNDPDFDQQWWLKPLNTQSNAQVNALPIAQRLRGVPRFQEAWSIVTGANIAATRVAVLDSGITDHEDLAGRWIGGYDFVSTVEYAGDGNGRDADPHDPGDFVNSTTGAFSGCELDPTSSWHGTKIAGLISALTNNNLGVAGANQGNLIVPVRVAGKCGADVSDIADGIRWAAGLTVANAPVNPNPARVINVSFGGTAACGNEYQSAINDVRSQTGAVVVAAAGNEHTAPTRPANCNNVIGVGALNRDGFKAVYSNFGALTVSTVGGDPDDTANDGAWNSFLGDGGLWTTTDTGAQSPEGSGYTSENVIGTSFSAPLVSATISLMLSRNSALTADQIVDGLKASARPHATVTALYNNTSTPLMAACSNDNPGRCVCTTSTCGAGILDAYEALRYAGNPTGYSAPARTAADINTAELIRAHAASAQDLPANPVNTPTPTPAGPCGRDGVCGGALQPAWLLGLLAASGALLWRRRGLQLARRR